jgi:hypothetical protein
MACLSALPPLYPVLVVLQEQVVDRMFQDPGSLR